MILDIPLGKIYIACPYSHRLERIRKQRADMATRCAAAFMMAGYEVYSPLSHTVEIEKYLPTEVNCNWSFWRKQSLWQVNNCNWLIQLTIDGWMKSVGCKDERNQAHMIGKRVYFLTPEEILGAKPASL